MRHLRSPTSADETAEQSAARTQLLATDMIDGNIHTHTELHGGFELHWTNRVDAAGSRIEWCIETDTQGWVSRYGPVFNQGVLSGSRAISTNADQELLLQELRTRIRSLASAMPGPSIPMRRVA